MDSSITKIGILAFAETAKLVTKPTNDYKKIIKDIQSIKVGDVGNRTDAEPFTVAKDTMRKKFSKIAQVIGDKSTSLNMK